MPTTDALAKDRKLVTTELLSIWNEYTEKGCNKIASLQRQFGWNNEYVLTLLFGMDDGLYDAWLEYNEEGESDVAVPEAPLSDS